MEIALLDSGNYSGSGHVLPTASMMNSYQDKAKFTRNQIVIEVENLYELSVGSLYAAVQYANVSDTNHTSSYDDGTCTAYP